MIQFAFFKNYRIASHRTDAVIERELKLSGYFVITTSEKMTATEALRLYKGRDASEKLFSGDKSYLGNKSYRNYYCESVDAKIDVSIPISGAITPVLGIKKPSPIDYYTEYWV